MSLWGLWTPMSQGNHSGMWSLSRDCRVVKAERPSESRWKENRRKKTWTTWSNYSCRWLMTWPRCQDSSWKDRFTSPSMPLRRKRDSRKVFWSSDGTSLRKLLRKPVINTTQDLTCRSKRLDFTPHKPVSMKEDLQFVVSSQEVVNCTIRSQVLSLLHLNLDRLRNLRETLLEKLN